LEGIERINAIRRNMEIHEAYDLLMKVFNKQLMRGELSTEQYIEKKKHLDEKLSASIVKLNS
tara:strand:+ start:2010 stop:2195 length:186 start_codon:yes stop_codon:yes gene_type:complete